MPEILQKTLRYFGYLCLYISVFLLGLFSWLCLLMALFSVGLSLDALLAVIKFAAPAGLLFYLAICLCRYLHRLVPPVKKKRIRWFNSGWIGLLLLTLLIVFLKFSLFPSDLSELAKQRRVAIEQQLLAPMQVYRQHHGEFPAALEDLVPDYLPSLPPVLQNSYYEQPAYQVFYYRDKTGRQATISYRDCLGPDCGAHIDLLSGEYTHDL